ncbi:MAG: hypothetical protein ACTSRS_14575 [Candidatus Helarchaeota archaeon]
MDLKQVSRNIERIKQWHSLEQSSLESTDEEILKPLNKLIDFEHKEIIAENGLWYRF